MALPEVKLVMQHLYLCLSLAIIKETLSQVKLELHCSEVIDWTRKLKDEFDSLVGCSKVDKAQLRSGLYDCPTVLIGKLQQKLTFHNDTYETGGKRKAHSCSREAPMVSCFKRMEIFTWETLSTKQWNPMGGRGSTVNTANIACLVGSLTHYIDKYRPNNDHNYLFLTNDGNAIL